MKILITESQYFKLLSEETESDKSCKIWVESKDDSRYKRYLIEYKVYINGYKLAKKNTPQVKNLQDYDYYSTDFIKNSPWFSFDESEKEYFSYGGGPDKFNHDEVKRMVTSNITKYGIKPMSLGYKDVMFPAYLKPKKVCIKPKPIETKPVEPKKVTEPESQPLRPNPITKFSVSWREDTPSREVNQNTHYFSNYDEWKDFVSQHPNPISQNENGSKTEAQALYSGLHADISKDKTVKGPR